MDTVDWLNQEIKEKVMFIQRLPRSSKDLQDLIAQTEQTYIKDLNDQKTTIEKLKKKNFTILTKTRWENIYQNQEVD